MTNPNAFSTRQRLRFARTGAAAVLTLVAAGAVTSTAHAQSLLYFQGFESQAADNWTFTNTNGAVSTAAGAGDTPASQRILTGANSFQVNNATSTLSLSSVSTTGYTGAYLTLRLSSTSSTTGNGADGGDYVRAFVALNGGTFATNSAANADISLAGNTNARYGYDATLTATTTAGTNLTLAAPQGNGSTNNYSTFRINLPDGTNSVALRLNLFNDAAQEFWNIDNISLFGTLAGPAAKDLTFNPGSRNFNTVAANTNFVITGGSTASAFTNGDTVRFTDAGVGAVAVDAGGVSPGATFVSNAAGTYTFSGGALNGTGALTKTGAGTLVLTATNGYAGGTSLNGGVTGISGDDRLGAVAGGVSFDGGTLRTDAAVTSARAIALATGGGTVDANGFDSSLTGNFSGAGSFTKTGSGTLSVSGNLSYTGTTAVTGGTLLLAQAANATVGLTAATAGGTFTGNLAAANAIRVNFNSGLFSGGGQIQVQTTGSTLATGGTSQTPTIGNAIVLNSNGVATPFSVNLGATSGNTLTVNGAISGTSDLNLAAGASGGAGILILGAQSTYTGATTINNSTSGIIRLTVADALPTGTALTFGTVSGAGPGTLDLNGRNQTVGALSYGGQGAAASAKITNGGTADSTFTVNGSTAPANAFSGVFSDGSTNKLSLVKAGTGTLALSGANTYSGGTTLNNGTLAIGVSSVVASGAITSGPVGKGTLTITGGTLLSTAPTAGGDRTINNNLNLSGSITLGDSTSTGILTFNNSVLTTKSASLTADTTLTVNSPVIITSALSGSFGLTKAGTSTLSLGGVNTFSGAFATSGGTTNLNVNGALGSVGSVTIGNGASLTTGFTLLTDVINNAAAVTLNGNGKLDLSGGTETVASVASTSTTASLVIGKYGTSSGGLTVGDSNSTTFAGVISEGAATSGTTTLTKQGTGALTLTNANTYSGNTIVNGGRLLAANATGSATGTSTVAVNNTGTLGGTGILSGAVNVNTGGTINAGPVGTAGSAAAVGTLRTGALTLAANSFTVADIASLASYDQIISTGALTLGGTFSATIAAGQTFNVGDTLSLLKGTGLSGTFSNIVNGQVYNFSGYDFTAQYTATEFGLVAVPEPATVAAGLLALGALGCSQRRRVRGLLGAVRPRRTGPVSA